MDIWFILWLILTLIHFGSGDFSTTGLSNCNSSLKWSAWINRDTPTAGDGDEEYMTPTEKQAFCGNGTIQNVECDTIGGIPYYNTGDLGVTCDVTNGSICKNAFNYPIPCSDYKIRYGCLVEVCTANSSTSQTRSTTTQSVVSSQSGMEVELIVAIIFAVITILGVTLLVVLFVWKRQSRKRKTTATTDNGDDDACSRNY